MKLFHVLVFLLIMSAPALAADVIYYEVATEIQPTGTTKNSLSFVIDPNLTALNFVIHAKVQDFRYESNIANIECSTAETIIGTEVSCSNIPRNGTNKLLKFNYNTLSYTTIDDKEGLFGANYKIPLDVQSASVAIKLPEGFVLVNNGVPPYSPTDGVITSDGQRIIIQWFKKDVPANTDFLTSVVYRDARSQPISDLSRVVVVSFVLVALFAIMAYFMNKNKQKEHQQMVLELLTSDEKRIINIIKENGSSVIQKKIVQSTDYSKAKVSRILKDLHTRGILEIKPQGRENLVTLTQKIKSDR